MSEETELLRQILAELKAMHDELARKLVDVESAVLHI